MEYVAMFGAKDMSILLIYSPTRGGCGFNFENNYMKKGA